MTDQPPNHLMTPLHVYGYNHLNLCNTHTQGQITLQTVKRAQKNCQEHNSTFHVDHAYHISASTIERTVHYTHFLAQGSLRYGRSDTNAVPGNSTLLHVRCHHWQIYEHAHSTTALLSMLTKLFTVK